jgi:WXXGXW repeat (2 copies)
MRYLTVGMLVVLGGCVAQVRVAAPPPPVVYVRPPPPPPAYAPANVEVEVQANEAPPPLPEYEQPACPDDGYIWTPGYWHYGPAGYYWVPGTWVQPPQVGVLWTPGYWAYSGGVYGFHGGYWGPHIGYYGGINYGYGYVGVGYAGGRWDGGHFAYNTAVSNVTTTTNIHNTYNQTVIINNVTVNKVSYNGGSGGVTAAPTAQERAAGQEPHVARTAAQTAHIQEASKNPALTAKANGGHPAIAATAKPGAFTGAGVVGARGAAPPATSNAPGSNVETHGAPAAGSAHAPNSGGAAAATNPANSEHQPLNNATQAKALTANPLPPKPPTKLAKRPPQKPKPKGAAKPDNTGHEREGDDKAH